MGVINISINNDVINVDFKNNMLIFLKNKIPCHVIPITNHYQIIKQNDSTYQIRKKTDNPNWIPRGYHNLSINEYGFFQVISQTINPEENTKRLFWVDTKALTPKDLYKTSNYTFKQNDIEIPDDFWFYPDYLYQEKSPSWSSIKQAKKYYKNFDPRNKSRIMSELECLCLYAKHWNKEEFIQDDISEYHDENIDITYQQFNFDNWLNPVSSNENKEEYRKIYKLGPIYQNEILPETEVTSLYLTPTIGKNK